MTDTVPPEQAEAIRSDKGSQTDIAKRYGISQPQVSRIKKGKAWQHLLTPLRISFSPAATTQ